MNKNIFWVFIIGLSLALMFAYRISNSADGTEIPQPIKLSGLSAEQKQYLSQKQILTVGITDDSAPLLFWDKSGQPQGLIHDFLGTFEEDYSVEFQYTPINLCEIEEKLLDGTVDLAVCMQDKDSEGVLSYTMPFLKTKGVLYLNQSRFSDDPQKSSSNLTILAVDGDPSLNKLKKAYTGATIIAAKSIQEASFRLLQGEGNAIAGSQTALVHFLGGNYLTKQFIQTKGYLYEKNYCLGVASKERILYDILNNGIYYMERERVISLLQGKWTGASYSFYSDNNPERMGIFVLIVFTAVLCVFLLFYQSNKSLYDELQQRMELLIESQNELRTTFDGVTYYMAELDREGRIININKAFSTYLQIKRHKTIGLYLTELLKADEPIEKKLSGLIATTFEEENEKSEEISIGRRIFEIHTFPLRDNKGKTAKILVMVVDVTDERSAERQMLQDNKMIAVGQLAAGVAHEIRNPLGLIRNYCYVLKELDQADKSTRDEAIRIIEKAVDKSGKIIENLLNFSRISSNKAEYLDLNIHLKAIVDLQKNLLGKQGISLYYEYKGDSFALVNIEALELILINLIANSADAIGNRTGEIRVSCNYTKGQSILLFVSDNGEGIAKEIIGDIYNPFFTTKKRREGNGLGLYIVYNEVQKMGGEIRLESEVGKGTVFIIWIPVQEEAFA